MQLVLIVLLGVAFTAVAAFVFAFLTILLGQFFKSFEISGPDDWTFGEFYKRYLIIAAVYTFITLPLMFMTIPFGVWIRLGALALAYKYVFDAGWTQAIVMGTIGGIIAVALFLLMLMIAAEMSPVPLFPR
jgi:hypothetical protein